MTADAADAEHSSCALTDGSGAELVGGYRPIPVVALCAQAPSRSDGFHSFLAKPAAMEDVLGAIRRAMER